MSVFVRRLSGGTERLLIHSPPHLVHTTKMTENWITHCDDFFFFFFTFSINIHLLFAPYTLCDDTTASVWLTFQHAIFFFFFYNTILANVGQCFQYICVRCVFEWLQTEPSLWKVSAQQQLSDKRYLKNTSSVRGSGLKPQLVNLFFSVLVNVNSWTCLFNGFILFTHMGPSVLKD